MATNFDLNPHKRGPQKWQPSAFSMYILEQNWRGYKEAHPDAVYREWWQKTVGEKLVYRYSITAGCPDEFFMFDDLCHIEIINTSESETSSEINITFECDKSYDEIVQILKRIFETSTMVETLKML